MKRIVVCGLFAFAVSLGLAGCSEKTEVKQEKSVQTPGGTTTQTETKEVTKSGDNPPPAPGPNP
jgi:hypothetical protein